MPVFLEDLIVSDINSVGFCLTVLFQIEWAWNYLSGLRDNQYHIARTLQTGSLNSASSRLSNGDSLTGDDDTALPRPHERSRHLGHSASQSPNHSGEVRPRDRNRSALTDVTSLAIEGLSTSNGVASIRSHAAPADTSSVGSRPRETGATGPGSQERSLVLRGDARMSPGSDKELSDQDSTASLNRRVAALALPEEEGSLRSLDARERRPRRLRQDDANDTFNTFASLPAATASRAHGNVALQAVAAQHADPQPSTGSKGTAGYPTTPELHRAEAAHRSERQFHSLDVQAGAEQGGVDYRVVDRYQSLQPQHGRREEDLDLSDAETRGAYGGYNRSLSMPHSYSASAKSDNHQVDFLSRKSFDICKRFKLKVCSPHFDYYDYYYCYYYYILNTCGSHTKNVSMIMIGVRLPSGHGTYLLGFSWTINAISDKLCKVIVLTELCPFVLLSGLVILT